VGISAGEQFFLGFPDLRQGNIKDPVAHGIVTAARIDRGLQYNARNPFINKDMDRILHDFDMRCTYEVDWQPCGDEDEILRFYRFKGQPAAIILPHQPEDHRRHGRTRGNGKTGDPYMPVTWQIPDDPGKNFCENGTDVVRGIVLLSYHEPHLHPESDDSLL
jgi:hypothetical protein